MPKSLIQALELSYFLHATEDESRVVHSVQEYMNLKAEPRFDELRGHFGNRILLVRYHLAGGEAERLFVTITSRLDRTEARSVRDTIHEMMDEHRALYLRLSKQELIKGRVVLSPSDPIRVKVKPRSFMIGGDAGKFYERIMGMK